MDKFQEILKIIRPIKEPNKKRFGRNWDGGYVLSQQIMDASKILVSLGINNEWSFEADCLKTKSFDRLIMVDDQSSPKIMWNQFLKSMSQFSFKFYDRKVFNDFIFRALKLIQFAWLNSRYKIKYLQLRIGNGPKETGLNQLIDQQRIQTTKKNILLKTDIEGSEYQIIPEIVNGSQKYSGVIIEFHDILSQPEEFLRAIRLMKQKFEIIHLHFNNYVPRNDYVGDVIEISFINSSFVSNPTPEDQPYPIPGLDFPCNRYKKDYIINWV